VSLGVAIKGPEGMVLAADSRVTVEAKQGSASPMIVSFDNATKLLSFFAPNRHIGVVTYGAALIGLRTAYSYVSEFELTLPENQRLEVTDFAYRLSNFFMERWIEVTPKEYSGPSMSFITCGYDSDYAYGKTFLFDIPKHPVPQPRNPGEREFGMTWGGQLQVASRLIHGYDPVVTEVIRRELNLDQQKTSELMTHIRQRTEFQIPYEMLPLQDCIDLAVFLIQTTISAQKLAIGVRGVGGTIEVATITRTEGLQYVQKKPLHVE